MRSHRSSQRWLAQRFFVVLVVVAILAAACGGDGDDDDRSDGGSSTTSESETSTETSSTATATTGVTTTATTDPATTDPAPAAEIVVFFGTGDPDVCGAVSPHTRSVPAGADPLRFAFDQLVGGPTDQERALGASSFFSAETDGSVRSVTFGGQTLVVDLDDVRAVLTPEGANTSCGSGALLGELNATAFQFPEVDTVRYELLGSCDRFGEWLQRGCIEVDRADWADEVAAQLPGEPADGILQPGAILGVIGVAADDQLNVRSLPGADRPIIATLDPLTTGLVFTGRERLLAQRSVWYEIEHDDVVGWVHSRFVGPLDGTFDVTSEVVDAAGGMPTAATMEELGAIVIETRLRFLDPETEPSSVLVDGPRVGGDLTEVIYDLTGFLDDSVLGERLHLFARDAGSGADRFELVSVEGTFICARGEGGGSDLCP